MIFVSTGGGAPETGLREALFRGLAPDGGLYVPARLPHFSRGELRALEASDWPEVAVAVAQRLLADALDPAVIRRLVRDALDFPVPLRPLTERIQVLELFHGPTLAFKDVGARFMARLMAHFRGDDPEPLTVLTATSGDTGGAVARAFLGLPGIRAVVLFPDGKVTPRQERQFSTLGRNVRAVAVQGDFDDCQRMAKAAFLDQDLRKRVALTSANSINVGRLIPQTFYYFLVWARLARIRPARARPAGTAGGGEAPILFTVPSGNFGNLAAGLMAGAMGLPGARFLAATNANDEVPEYLETGRFRPRPSVRTLSTAMDVGDPSNLARILHLYGHDLDRLRRDLDARTVSDQETRDCIRRVHAQRGYVLDPHSAVGYRALEKELEEGGGAGGDGAVGVLLATAHPAKFAEVVEPVLGEPLSLPPELAECLERERVVSPMEPDSGALKEYLLGG